MNTKISRLLLIIGVLMGLVVTAGCDGFDDHVANNDFIASEAFSFDVPVANKVRFRLEAINGTIEINGSDGASSVVVAGERKVTSESRRDAERHLEYLEVQLRDRASEVYVETVQPNQSHGRNYIVDYTITLPAHLDVVVDHINGNIEISDMMGELDVDLINGNIDYFATDPPGGDLNLSIVNGNIGLGIPTNLSAMFFAETINGQISLSNLSLEDLVSTSRSMTGRVGAGDWMIRLSVVNGTITVTGHE